MTKAEKRLWRRLKSSSIMEGWKPQIWVGWYRVDFYNSKAHISVEVDGRHHQFDANQRAYDKRRTAYLDRSYHLDELRFSNDDVFERMNWVLEQIIAAYRRAIKRYRDPVYWFVENPGRPKKRQFRPPAPRLTNSLSTPVDSAVLAPSKEG